MIVRVTDVVDEVMEAREVVDQLPGGLGIAQDVEVDPHEDQRQMPQGHEFLHQAFYHGVVSNKGRS